MKQENYGVVYYNDKGISPLVGVYRTPEEARFISEAIKRIEKLNFFPKIQKVSAPVTTVKVAAFLEYLKNKKG